MVRKLGEVRGIWGICGWQPGWTCRDDGEVVSNQETALIRISTVNGTDVPRRPSRLRGVLRPTPASLSGPTASLDALQSVVIDRFDHDVAFLDELRSRIHQRRRPL